MGEHDYDYDHEAFLGDEAEEFDHLTPEESQHRLAAIVDKIDKVSKVNQVCREAIWSVSLVG